MPGGFLRRTKRFLLSWKGVFVVSLLLAFVIYWVNGAWNAVLDVYDGNIVRYIVVNNLTRFREYSFKYGIPQNMFNGNALVPLYTDSMYLLSLLYAPIWFITHNTELLLHFIRILFVVLQVMGLVIIFKHLHALAIGKDKSLNLWFFLTAVLLVLLGVFFVYPFWGPHPHLLFTEFFTLFVAFLLEFVSSKRFSYLLLAFISLLSFANSSVYYLVYSIYILALMVVGIFLFYRAGLIRLLRSFKSWRFSKWIDFPLMFITLAGIIFTILNYFPYTTLSTMGIKRPIEEAAVYSADLLVSFTVPLDTRSKFYSIIFGDLVNHIDYSSLTHEAFLFIGVSGFFLILLFFWGVLCTSSKVKRWMSLWLFLLLGIYVFTGGPWLKWGFKTTHIPLPYNFLWHTIILFRAIRVPARIFKLYPLFLSSGLYVLLISLMQWGKGAALRFKVLMLLLLLLLVVIDITPSFIYVQKNRDYESFLRDVTLYKVEKDLIDQYRRFLMLPAFPRLYKEGRYLPLLTIYPQKRLINGYSGRFPEDESRFLEDMLAAGVHGNNILIREKLCDWGVDAIFIHKEYLEESSEELQGVVSSNLALINRLMREFPSEHLDQDHILIKISCFQNE